MQKETEIKLRVSRETLAALREHPLLKKRTKLRELAHSRTGDKGDTSNISVIAFRAED